MVVIMTDHDGKTGTASAALPVLHSLPTPHDIRKITVSGEQRFSMPASIFTWQDLYSHHLNPERPSP